MKKTGVGKNKNRKIERSVQWHNTSMDKGSSKNRSRTSPGSHNTTIVRQLFINTQYQMTVQPRVFEINREKRKKIWRENKVSVIFKGTLCLGFELVHSE